ncbi:MAG TPA: TonB-dependent receptor [Kofleriaceae bacterium]|nr:TonB-dependent receptor [Kofleriaceae bacterium]
MMNAKNLFIAAALVGIGLGAVRTASAQSNTAGAVHGVVTDKATGEPLAGVTVVATSTALQGTASAITEADGTYKITNLPPGTYVVTFYYADITVKRTNVPVSVSKVTPAFVKIDQNQAQGEVIEIKGTPTIDTTSTAQGITLDQNYTRNIPIPGRTFESALGAAAGSAGDGLGVSFSGSTSLENQYVVDGVNTTGLTYGTVGSPIINDFIEEIEIITGGYQAEYGRSTGGVVNVVTKSGTNEFHGTVFSQFTNDFIAKDPTRNPTQATPIDVESNLVYDMTFGAELGGPIIKDKLWFFIGFAPRLISVDNTRITKRMTDCRMTLPDGSLSDCDPSLGDGTPDEDENGFFIFEDIQGGRRKVNSQATEYQFVSKLNYSLSPEHQGQVSFSGTPFTSEIIGVYGEQPAVSRDITVLTTDASVKWTSKFNNNKTEVETVLGWHRDHFKSDSIDDSVNDTAGQRLLYGNLGTWGLRGYESMQTVAACTDSGANDPYPFIENCPDLGVGYGIGGPGALADDTEQRFSARLSGTQRVKAAGTHEVKAGVDVEQNLLNKPRTISGDAFYNVYVGNSLTGGAINETEMQRWVQIAPDGETDPRFDQTCGPDPGGLMGEQLRCDFLGPTDVEGNTINWAAYLRDSWQILPNLTFNAGVRYEEQRLRFAKALQNTPDPYTQEIRGKNAMTMRNMWAPRVGLLYDWTKEGRSKVFASYGRFYESIPMDINDRSFGGETLLIRTYDQSAQCGAADTTIGAPSGTACPADEEGALGDDVFGGSGVLVAPGVKPQYMDEFIIGSEYEVLEDLKVGLALKRRTLGRVLEDVSVDSAATYILANPGEFPESEEEALEQEIADLMAAGETAEASRKQGQLEQFRGIRQFDKPRRDYHAIELTTQKRFSRNFFMQGSYTYSRVTGNFPGLFSADNGQVDPNITSQYDLIELLANRDGPLPQDRPHYFKLDGYYIWKLDDLFGDGGEEMGEILTGGRFRAFSGVVQDALARHYLYGFDESFLLPRGEMGRNDVAWGLDAKIGYGRKLGHGMKLDIYTDLYSVEYLFLTEHVAAVDETYTFDNANPVVGGNYSDLIWVKEQDTTGIETSTPISRNRNFQNVSSRYNPFFVQIGARLSF